ncbi:MAG: hypothetical protein RIB86_24795 [Imperialibacter sp.]
MHSENLFASHVPQPSQLKAVDVTIVEIEPTGELDAFNIVSDKIE